MSRPSPSVAASAFCAAKDGLLRVIDEDEDYLYPSSWFVAIEIPHELEEKMAGIARH